MSEAPSSAVDEVLALMDEWCAETGSAEEDEATVAALDRAREEDPIRFREPDLSAWREDGEEEP